MPRDGSSRGGGVLFSALFVSFVTFVSAPGCASSEVTLCGDGIGEVLAGVTGNPAYDSIEKRVGGLVIAKVGEPCGGATAGTCKDRYDEVVKNALGPIIIVTRGDTAEGYPRATMPLLGGEIDTAAEAGLWVVGVDGVGSQCGSIYELVARPRDGGGFEVTRGASEPGGRCTRTTIAVAKDGTQERTTGSEECPSGATLP